MIKSKKWLSLIYLGVTLIILVLLSSGISNVEFQIGRPFFLRRNTNDLPDLSDLNFQMWHLSGVWEVIGAFILWVLLPLSVIYFIVSPEARKKTLRQAIRMSLVGYSLFILLRQCGRINPDRFPNFDQFLKTSTDTPFGENFDTSLSFEPSFLVIFLASLFLAGLIFGGFWLFWRAIRPTPTIEQLGSEAQAAILKLKVGQEFSDTILDCYAEMIRILGHQKGIYKRASTTPHEFELELKEIGLPRRSVEKLTWLFEQARYGRKEFEPSQHQEAISCLNEIVEVSEAL